MPKVFLFLLFVLATGHVAAQTYPIKLDRVRQVGDRYVISTVATTEQHVVVKMGGSEVNRQDSVYSIHFLADAEVTGIDAKEGRSIIAYSVRRCVKVMGEDTTELMPVGTELEFRKSTTEARKQLTAKNGDVSEASLKYVEDALAEIGSGRADEDIGTKKPQPVGGSWKINEKRAAEQINKTGALKIDPKKMKAKAKLVSVGDVAGEPAMTVAVDMDIDKVGVPGLKEKGYKLESSVMNIRFAADYPLDAAKGPLRTSLSLGIAMSAISKPDPNLPNVHLDMQSTRSATTEFTYK